jgi:hypothetical protein
VVLALLIIRAKVEAFWADAAIRNLHGLVEMEGDQLEGQHSLIDTSFATRVLAIDHRCGVPIAVAKKTEIALTIEARLA